MFSPLGDILVWMKNLHIHRKNKNKKTNRWWKKKKRNWQPNILHPAVDRNQFSNSKSRRHEVKDNMYRLETQQLRWIVLKSTNTGNRPVQ